MTYVNTEEIRRAASTAQSAANDMCRAAGTAEEAARSLRCLFEEGYGSPALELLELLRNQDRDLRHENQQLSAELDALGKLLPGTMYMDPPDGGSPTIGEQITRMIADLQNQKVELVAQNGELGRLLKAAEHQTAKLTLIALGEISLLDVEAAAGRAGYIEATGIDWEQYTVSEIEQSADEYAESVKAGKR